ncbi:MAG TPA: NAD(P)-dependent oxidoreductase [Clostridiales bacterium]|nr:NAD(P)-dependent oxidoreductase [Clostridiales bacterium]HQK73726.1 NAD(P)-dependent oxidoreductase [Clostridiales bacterium]
MKSKKTVFLTGATGNMGWAGFQELYKRKDQYDIVVLIRKSPKNEEMFRPYADDKSVRIVWGDLTVYEDVLTCVNGADYVLHVGGMVSPAADYYPKKTIKTNTTAAENIVRAVKAQPDPDAVKVVYIGTVAETGDRNPPIHWARTGDPIKISIYDHYAVSKVIAERTFAESGLKYWVSLRQSGILYPAILKNYDPIMFHVPINGVLEWATIEDSGLLCAKVCGDDVPEEFWRRFYNIGSGDQYRITNFEFEEYLLKAIGMSSPKKIFEPNWFILRNFHGQWYADGDVLENYLHFRANVPIDQYFDRMSATIPKYYKLAKIAPGFLVKKFGMEPLTNKPVYGTMSWIKNNDPDRISAYFGSREAWEKIGGWDTFKIEKPTKEVTLLDHGYDESKPVAQLDIEDMRQAARFRGGECLSDSMQKGDLFTPLRWKSARGNEFEMSPNLVLKGGHWCPAELPWPWDYDQEARINPFFAQVWYPLHGKDENNYYDESIFKDFKD